MPAAYKTYRRVTDLDLVRDVQDLDLSVELAHLAQCRVPPVHHHISSARHVFLRQSTDVQAHVVPGLRGVHTLMVHLHRKDLPAARIRGRVRGQEHHFFAWFDDALLHAACEHIANPPDFVDARDGHAHRRGARPLGHTTELVQHVVNGVAVHRLLAALHLLPLPP